MIELPAMTNEKPERRDFLTKSAAALFTTNIFTGQVRGANDKVSAAFIGVGRMGQGNLNAAMKQDNLEVVAVCDIYKPNLDKAIDMTKGKAKGIKDFREIMADKSIDVVNISTPDQWHAYMTVEACKAGKDVYVEKPISVTIEEGQKMVQAARKYKRVVQAGTMQRSGAHFQEATKMVMDGKIGKVTAIKTWNYGLADPAGIGNPPDGAPIPEGLDWDMWLGPAPKRPFNANRWGVDPKAFSHFRWFWDTAGGMMTDWGVHVLDIAQMGTGDVMPKSVNSFGGKLWYTDNRETADTLMATYDYGSFLANYEHRSGNANSMFGKGYGTMFLGSKATLFVDRSLYHVYPEKGSGIEEVEVKSSNNSNVAHWANFLDCVKTRQKPISDIEVCYKSTVTCLLANISLRSGKRVDWDAAKDTIVQPDLKKWMRREERAPWKIEV